MAGLQPRESQAQTNLFQRNLNMKKQLYFYVVLVIAFIAYNQFFQVQDEKMNTLINILFASFLFLYIGYIAYVVLKRLRKSGDK